MPKKHEFRWPGPSPRAQDGWRRRDWLWAGGSAAAALLVPAQATAQFRVEIAGVGGTQIPISFPKLRDEDAVNTPIASIVLNDLARSGRFRTVETDAAITESTPPAYADWRARGADVMAGGSVMRLADGRVDVRFRLWDLLKSVELGGRAAPYAPADLRLAAHQIADYIYEKLTGEKGVFSTRIAYVTRGAGRFTLRVADADGENSQVVLNSYEPIISPAWSPDGRELAYVSFETQKAVIWAQDVASGKRRQIANFRGSNSAPAWSPDGQSIAATLSRDGGSQIYLMDINGNNPRRVASSSAIDTEPVFSPDGKQLYFVSDRGGGPQIYRVPVAGGNVERVSFSGSYNISPAISPDGRTMAYVSRSGNAFKLMTLDLASGATQSLTDTSDDESPSFAPNGRMLIYATSAGGRNLVRTIGLDGSGVYTLVTSANDVREPAWGPFGR